MGKEDDFDPGALDRAQQALSRWLARSKVRDGRSEALREGKPTLADTPSRLAARVNVLVDEVRRAAEPWHMPSNRVLRGLVERPTPVVAEELTDQIVNEALIGTADFLSVEFLERGALAARSVGRILIETPGARQALGTGFMVGPGLLLTNQHVLTSDRRAARCALQMDYELRLFGAPRAPQEFALQPDRFFLADEELDFALVAVAGTSTLGMSLDDYGWLPLNEAQGKISISDKDHVNIVQHPRGAEKQVVLRNNRVLDMRTGNDPKDEMMGSFLHYEADTDKGSSGSPVLSDTWQVVALHHSGVPRPHDKGGWQRKDGGQWRDGQDREEDIDWVANEAVRVSGIVGAIRLAALEPAVRVFVDTALAARPPAGWSMPGRKESVVPDMVAVAPPQPAMPAEAAPDPAEGRQQVISLDIPLRLTLSLAAQVQGSHLLAGAAPSLPTRPATAFLERITPEEMADRPGYDPDFLGFNLPLPGTKAKPRFGGALPISHPSRPGDRQELRYHGYSVLICAGRRLAYLSACNVDFLARVEVSSNEGGGNWRFDPRIPRDAQLGNSYYLNNDYDRGHLSRRNDLARGPTRDAAIAANKDSYFWTNCAPQHYLLNQSTDFSGADLQLWGDLENHISAQGAKLRRLSVFNGPVFGTADKPLRDALVPLAFYKIVAWSDADGPGAVGFVLEQADLIETLPEERLDPGIFSIRQRRIEAIGAELDIDLCDLSALDRMPKPRSRGKSATKEAFARDGIEITSVADILL
ncbi:DNA/RNA non-specific endonuclease [Paracoccus lutimaris]|uniref:Serine protease n=1 Tax=Paracoccus lutimaris TaxID=1490030 RepID=A0A368YV65_9RHOB|nr:DNA/RNA non-specific endonuclease [Paracoccus lutimaris]RCW84063.1 endonuclease G [Paracoccus lutimaris]